MATLKINVMSILAIVVMVTCVVAVGLYESLVGSANRSGAHEQNTYEAFLIISILLALVVLVVTCMDIEQVKTKTFLIYALAAILLLIGIGVFGNLLRKLDTVTLNFAETFSKWIASIVFAALALIASIAGAVAPFVCNK